MKKSILIYFLITVSSVVLAQSKRGIEYSGFFDTYYWRGPVAYSLGVNSFLYTGDFCEDFGCNQISPGVSVGVGYKVWPHVYFGGDFNYWSYGATDEGGKQRAGLEMTGTAMALNLYGRYYLREDIIHRHGQTRNKPKVFKPFFLLGIGAGQFSPTVTLDGEVSSEESAFGVYVPGGIGASLDFSHRVSLLVEFIANYSLSDDIDGLGADATGSNNNDFFGNVNVKLEWRPKAKRMRRKKMKLHPPSTGGSTGEGGEGGSSTSSFEKPTTSNSDTENVEEEPLSEEELETERLLRESENEEEAAPMEDEDAYEEAPGDENEELIDETEEDQSKDDIDDQW